MLFINLDKCPSSTSDEYAQIAQDLKLLRLVLRDLLNAGVEISVTEKAGFIPLIPKKE
jgi:hypothetical protein